MDYSILAIIVLGFMLIVSLIYNFVLLRKIERLEDAYIIDDITPEEEFYKLNKDQRSKIIYM